ncbi:leucine-rich repeat and coiled-coil domain-containing protein 1-like [Corticium candelabrum]|uniref:leucine-rich repeat and coiled-coil domain-containing protein 1-like n=1 Tax=Corticium candelabrum TaxID=121492 RepID=UPI002E261407|nr:leucine-rich repeat and coiled-coil domain-containing protein 1-like [Corticium candelabrum]
MSGSTYRLSVLLLHGNRIRTVDHVIQCLTGCVALRELTLVQDGRDNPVCRVIGYRKKALSGLKGLQSLDGVNREGKTGVMYDDLDTIPGLDQYVEYLLSSSPAEDSIEFHTPHIDQALKQFHNQVENSPTPNRQTTSATRQKVSETDDEQPQGQSDTALSAPRLSNDHEDRLKQLEEQLAALAHQHAATLANLHTQRQHTRQASADSDSEKSDVVEVVRHDRVSSGKTRSPQSRKSLPQAVRVRSAMTRLKRRSKEHTAQRKGTQETEITELVSELDEERERRLKAEQATKKLVDLVKSLQQRASEDQQHQQSAIARLSQFKQTLIREKEQSAAARQESERLQEGLDSYREQCEQQQKALTDTEKAAAKLESEHFQQQAAAAKELDETRRRSSALSRELDLNHHTIKQSKIRIQELQELLAAREQEHRNQLAARVNVSNPEVQNVVHHELRKEREKWELQMRHYEEKIASQQQAYADLEDEFRAALRIEENRFCKIQTAFEKAAHESRENRRLGQVAAERESKATALLSELTALVKEQKGRITELTRSKQESLDEYKERLSAREVELHEVRKEMVRLAAVDEENSKLKAEMTAQRSVIEGLRRERELWSAELAQQGAALAQDRGSLEAKVKSLTTQVSDLRLQTQRDNDTIRIKSKMLDDQTESIRNLKQRITEAGEKLEQVREEAGQAQDELEDQLGQSQAQNQDMEEQLASLVDRKEELKDQLARARDDLEKERTKHCSMKQQWEERLSSMDLLEQEMQKVKETFAAKVKQLTEEKHTVEEQARSLVSKLRSCDDAFRQQLEAKERSHNDAMAQLRHDQQAEIDIANRRVVEVEEEMRQLLHEMAAEKRAMESRMQKLAVAFNEVRDGISV